MSALLIGSRFHGRDKIKRNRCLQTKLLTIKETPDGVTFSVRVLPRSSRNEVIGESEGILRIKLTAPPVEGAANKALVEFLSDRLKVAKSRINILTGQTGRAKVISVTGLKKADISHLLS